MKKEVWALSGVVVVLICVVYLVFSRVFPMGETSGSQSPNPTISPFPNPITSQSPNLIIIANSSLFEKVIEVKIFDNGTVKCHHERYYPWYKEVEIRRGRISMEKVEKLLELFSKLASYGEYVDKVSDEFMKEGHILEPPGSMGISCLPLNKTLNISFRPFNFPEPETITPEAEEILAIIDKAYLETEVVELIKKANS